jgi:hypothetical protein
MKMMDPGVKIQLMKMRAQLTNITITGGRGKTMALSLRKDLRFSLVDFQVTPTKVSPIFEFQGDFNRF